MSTFEPIIHAFLFVWYLVVFYMDMRFRRVPWRWSLFGLAVAIVFRFSAWLSNGQPVSEGAFILLAAAAGWRLWRAGIWGGADAKTAMTLAVVNPYPLGWLVIGATVLVSALAASLARGQFSWPSVCGREAVLKSQRSFPMAAVLSLGGLLCMLL